MGDGRKGNVAIFSQSSSLVFHKEERVRMNWVRYKVVPHTKGTSRGEGEETNRRKVQSRKYKYYSSMNFVQARYHYYPGLGIQVFLFLSFSPSLVFPVFLDTHLLSLVFPLSFTSLYPLIEDHRRFSSRIGASLTIN